MRCGIDREGLALCRFVRGLNPRDDAVRACVHAQEFAQSTEQRLGFDCLAQNFPHNRCGVFVRLYPVFRTNLSLQSSHVLPLMLRVRLTDITQQELPVVYDTLIFALSSIALQ
jgi:hypothetical protein